MNITLVRRGYSGSGGAESYLKRLGKGLVDAHHEASLFCTEDWPETEWPYGKLIRVQGSTPIRFADAVRRQRDPQSILLSLERIWECDCYRAGDGVHRAWLARRAEFEPSLKKRLRFLNRKHSRILELEESLFKQGRARHIIANSQLVKNEIVREFAYPAKRITVIYNGLPAIASAFDPDVREEARRRWGLKGVAVLFAGSGWERKGLRFAIQAIRGMEKIQLVVAGTGKKPAGAPRNVLFLGRIRDMHLAYAAADIFILPTIYDPFSNACLEALSFGLPIVTTDSNGFSEIITSGVHGEIVDRPDKIEALRTAIETWSDPGKRSHAHHACKELAAQYTMDRNVRETVRVLQTIALAR
jgi:UDP-glucose:(heptosyl)LPS alpha-1,3-glucosyltransferase